MSVGLRAASLCAGIGGLDLGVKLAVPTARTICYVEREAFACEVLGSRMEEGRLDGAPIWSDLRTFDGKPWRGVLDLVVAGAPCQPFSSASRGRKVAADLLPEVLRVLRESGAWLLFVENVLGAGRRLEQFRCELQDAGYDSPPLAEVSSACVGAPHDRKRLWLLAYAHGDRERLLSVHEEVARSPEIACPAWQSEDAARVVLGMADGPADRMDRLQALGNAVSPPQAALAFRSLLKSALN